MEKQFLFESEEVLVTSGDNSVTLTNRRLRKNKSSLGKKYITSMHLENISSIEVDYQSRPLVLVAGILLLLAGLHFGTQNHGDKMVMFLIAGVICIVIYWFTRRHIITVASDGGARIQILTDGMSTQDVLDFVNKIEQAKSLINERSLPKIL